MVDENVDDGKSDPDLSDMSGPIAQPLLLARCVSYHYFSIKIGTVQTLIPTLRYYISSRRSDEWQGLDGWLVEKVVDGQNVALGEKHMEISWKKIRHIGEEVG